MQNINKFLKIQKLYIFFISLVLFIIIFFTSFLYANTFKVSDIKISSPFELNFNKNRVIDDGFRVSFFNLISMITTSGDKDKIKNIQLKEIKGMIDSFTISDEKFINNVYFAKLETTFNKKKTLFFLENKNIFPSIGVTNKILLIPILVDVEKDNIYLFNNNIFYKKWNEKNKSYYLLDYLLPTEDLDDLNKIQEMSSSIENYDFTSLITKYDLKDYIVSIIFKNKQEIKVLSRINFNDSLKLDNTKFEKINLNDEDDFEIILENLKNIYENYWKKNNQINTSIKLPLTVSINSRGYKKIAKLEETFNATDLISDFYILKFDSETIQYRVVYNGSPKNFLNTMKKNNFDLDVKNKIWIIR